MSDGGPAKILDVDDVQRLKQTTLSRDERLLAAVHLCVPNSGIPELDDMIRRAQRQAYKLAVIQGWAANGQLMIEMKDGGPFGSMAIWAGQAANALIAEDAAFEEREKAREATQ